MLPLTFRTTAAGLLTAAALAVPLAAWYLAGAREAAREAAEIEAEPTRTARGLARGLAEKLAARLEVLREAESKRPFYHYKNVFHDPNVAAQGPAIVPSPLAEGPQDPLIRNHFQIDPKGRLTLPTINDDVPELNPKDVGMQRMMMQDLQDNAGQFANYSNRFQGGKKQSATPNASPASKSNPTRQQKEPEEQVQTIDSNTWAYNTIASQVYQEFLQRRNKPTPQAQGQSHPLAQFGGQQSAAVSQPQQKNEPSVTILVGPLLWNNMTINSSPTLVALRDVKTPAGILTQGFEISHAAVEKWLAAPPMPVRFLSGPPAGDNEARVPIEGVDWRVAVDTTAAADAALGRAREWVSRFQQTFLLVTGLSILAGLFVVGFVWQAERLARVRSRFAASAAHELRTPLAGLRMYGEMLAEGLGDPNRSKDYARRVADEAERLGRVVSNVLGFSRLERGALRVRPEPGDLAALVRECVERQRPAIEALGARVELAIADPCPPARFDRDAVAQILQNLLDNAEKYTRGAADRTLRVELAAAPSTTGERREGTGDREQGTGDRGQETGDRGQETGDAVALVVSDRGPGIPPDVRRRLFKPFARGNGDADAPAGLGLGLTLARALARAQGGDVAYADAPGGGAAFTVAFPAA